MVCILLFRMGWYQLKTYKSKVKITFQVFNYEETVQVFPVMKTAVSAQTKMMVLLAMNKDETAQGKRKFRYYLAHDKIITSLNNSVKSFICHN